MKKSFIIGVDEAGRGPLAGPVAVGVVCIPKGFKWKLIQGVNDSKKLSEKKREEVFKCAKRLQKEGKLKYKVSMVSARVIDNIGINTAVNCGIQRAFKSLYTKSQNTPVNWSISTKSPILLDGGLRAPKEYKNQKTIIKGDQKEKVIGLASIMAKVTRDRYMTKICKDSTYIKYGFDLHKGYGTKRHRKEIRKLGLSSMHRVTYCKNIKVL